MALSQTDTATPGLAGWCHFVLSRMLLLCGRGSASAVPRPAPCLRQPPLSCIVRSPCKCESIAPDKAHAPEVPLTRAAPSL